MIQTLFIVAACADRKREEPASQFRLGSLTIARAETRARTWINRLRKRRDDQFAAADLYLGPWWSNVVNLETTARHTFEANLFVASAGYGLVHRESRIGAYSATFAKGHVDSVVRPTDPIGFDNQRWWTLLSNWSGPVTKHPRSVAELAASNPRASVLFLGSPDYVSALSSDLLTARDTLDDPDRLVVVTSVLNPGTDGLSRNTVNSGSRLLTRVGGSRITLHARVALALLHSSPPRRPLSADRWAKHATLWSAECPYPKVPHRAVVRDEVVADFISEHLTGRPAHTPLLRAFRATGLACEQKRFREIFLRVCRRHAQ